MLSFGLSCDFLITTCFWWLSVVYIRQLMTKLIDGFDLCDLSPLPHAAPPTLRPPTSCWPLKWDPDVAIVMCEFPCLYVDEFCCCTCPFGDGRIKWSPEECLKMLCSSGGGLPSVDHVSGLRFKALSLCLSHSLSLSISMGFSLWEKQ